jgi:hypothetical protein
MVTSLMDSVANDGPTLMCMKECGRMGLITGTGPSAARLDPGTSVLGPMELSMASALKRFRMGATTRVHFPMDNGMDWGTTSPKTRPATEANSNTASSMGKGSELTSPRRSTAASGQTASDPGSESLNGRTAAASKATSHRTNETGTGS